MEDDDKSIVDFYTNNIMIKKEKKYYIDLLKLIRNENIKMKKVLELKYYYLTNYYNIIQCSVIFFSTLSSFIQAVHSMNKIIIIDNNVVYLTTLIISTLISLFLSIAKFFKISENKEDINNLLSDISQFNNKVISNIKKIKYWKVNLQYIQDESTKSDLNIEDYNNNYEIKKWIDFSNKIKEEINTYIDQKLEIMNGYERSIDTYERTKYDIKNTEIKNKFTIKEHKIIAKHNNTMEELENNENCCKQIFNCICLFFIYSYKTICCTFCIDYKNKMDMKKSNKNISDSDDENTDPVIFNNNDLNEI